MTSAIATGRRACKRCGQEIATTPTGHLRAHACPHGACCVPSYRARRAGDRAGTCGECKQRGQRSLF